MIPQPLSQKVLEAVQSIGVPYVESVLCPYLTGNSGIDHESMIET